MIKIYEISWQKKYQNRLYQIKDKFKVIVLCLVMLLSFSANLIAADYTEGEEAHNETQEDTIAEELSMEKVCTDVRGKCLDSVKVRIVDGMSVERDCWKYEYSKNCNKAPSKNNCANIQQEDFKFVGDTCLSTIKVNGKIFCVNTRKTFARTTTQTQEINHGKMKMDPDNKEVVKNLLCGAFCLDGNCPEAYKANQGSNDEIANAIAQLEMLSNIKKGMIDSNALKFDIFSATLKRCHNKKFHSNCCPDNGSGLFISLGFHKCSKDDAALIAERRKSKCEYVGEYCAKKEKITRICLRKTKSYCCFPTVLAKAIHRGARDQLGKNLGSAEHPNCGGLTLEDIEKIDFSKVDFQEFFDLEVQPMMKGYSSDDNEALIKRAFPSGAKDSSTPGAKDTNSNSFPNMSKDGVNEKLFKNSE